MSKQETHTALRAMPEDIANQVRSAVARPKLSTHVKAVTVADYDDLDDEILRVVIVLDALEDLADGDLEALTAEIETNVSETDDRFPSVRFAEAA